MNVSPTPPTHLDDEPAPARWVRSALEDARGQVGRGTVPAFLTAVRPAAAGRSLGLAYVTNTGDEHGAGGYRSGFSLQSLTKLFSLALVLARDGEGLWRRVSYSAPMLAYDSVPIIDTRPGRLNPFLNSGALVVTDRLHTLTGHAAETVRAFLGRQSGNPGVHSDDQVAASELARSQHNAALAYELAAAGVLSNPPGVVLEQYVSQCAIAASCLDVARAATFLSRGGRDLDGNPVIPRRDAHRLVGLLSLSGTYAASADTMYRIGLPAKSGIGGGIIALVPGRGAVCAASPGLDEHGTSIAAGYALESFSRQALEL